MDMERRAFFKKAIKGTAAVSLLPMVIPEVVAVEKVEAKELPLAGGLAGGDVVLVLTCRDVNDKMEITEVRTTINKRRIL